MSEVISTRKWNSQYKHFVGIPNNNSIGKYLACGLDIQLNTEISAMNFDGKWCLSTNEKEFADFDHVILAMPAEQSLQLMPKKFEFFQDIKEKMLACYSLMLGFDSFVRFHLNLFIIQTLVGYLLIVQSLKEVVYIHIMHSKNS